MQNNDLSKIYYRQRDGSYYIKMTKDEIIQKINPVKLSTFIPILKDMNYAILLDQWFSYYQKHLTSKAVIGRYISYMQLVGLKNWSYNDSQLYYDAIKRRKSFMQNNKHLVGKNQFNDVLYIGPGNKGTYKSYGDYAENLTVRQIELLMRKLYLFEEWYEGLTEVLKEEWLNEIKSIS